MSPTRLSEAPSSQPVQVVRERSGGWWAAAIVAILAVVAIMYLLAHQATSANLAEAREQGAVEARLTAAAASAEAAAIKASSAADTAIEGARGLSDAAAVSAANEAEITSLTVQSASAKPLQVADAPNP